MPDVHADLQGLRGGAPPAAGRQIRRQWRTPALGSDGQTFTMSSVHTAGLAAQERPLLLVVEDEDATRTALGELLDLEGYDVALARDGMAALEVLDRSRTALVLTDLHMPRLGGVGLLRALADDGTEVGVVAVTADPDGPDARAAEALGVVEILTKPVCFDALLAAVRRGLSFQPA